MAKVKKKKRVMNYRRILVRCPHDLAEWLDDTAAEFGLSRDAFLRMQFEGIREAFKLAAVEGTPESTLFRRLEDRLSEQTSQAVERAVADVLRSTGGVARAASAPSIVKGGKS